MLIMEKLTNNFVIKWEKPEKEKGQTEELLHN